MPLHLRSRRKKLDTILREFPDAEVIDVTSKGPEPWVKFSPFYTHYDIPVPFWEGKTAACVEAIWQALKVFETADVDEAALSNGTMRNIKRTVRRLDANGGQVDFVSYTGDQVSSGEEITFEP